MTGTGGTGTNYNDGVRVTGGTLDGDVRITGTSGAGGIQNHGVNLVGVNLVNTLATSMITGTAGAGAGSNHGVSLRAIKIGGVAAVETEFLGTITGTAAEGEDKFGDFFVAVLPAFLLVAGAVGQKRRKGGSVLDDQAVWEGIREEDAIDALGMQSRLGASLLG